MHNFVEGFVIAIIVTFIFKANSTQTMNTAELTLGFVGCGKISSALCRGYSGAEEKTPSRILVSERSQSKSASLKAEFPDLVEIAPNDDIVRRADIVFIGLLPGVARDLLPKLPWHSGNKVVISMMAAIDFEEVCRLVQVDASRIVRTVPLPSSARRCGPILQYPPHEDAQSILSVVGTPIVCANEKEMKPLISITGHISPFYALMRTTEEFLLENGVADSVSRDFVASFFSSLAQAAEMSSDSFEEMCVEAATPGGLNEQAVGFLRGTDHYDRMHESLDAILARLNKK